MKCSLRSFSWTCHCPALWGMMIGAATGLIAGAMILIFWLIDGDALPRGRSAMILLIAPFFGAIWGSFGGFIAGAVPRQNEHRLPRFVTLLLLALAGALGGGTGGLAFGLLVDRGAGLSTPMWTLLAALTGAFSGVLALAQQVSPATHREPLAQGDPQLPQG